MSAFVRRALARSLPVPILLAAALPFAAAAQAPLTLTEAGALALRDQPLLEAQHQAVLAAREAAVAGAQWPDPMLVAALADVPVTGPERYTLRGDPDTQLKLAVRQQIPGGGAAGLRGERGQAQARQLAAELDEQRRMVRREASLHWLDAWLALRRAALLAESAAEAQRQADAVEIAFRAGRASQAEVLAARVQREQLEDERAAAQQDERRARHQLARWIGEAAERPLAPEVPAWSAPDASALAARLEAHPHLAAQGAAIDVARSELALARAAYRPDWAVQAGYGWRPEFDDMAMLEVEIGLPLFTARRQDRAAAGRAAELERVRQLRDDWLRQHRADVALGVAEWTQLQERLRRYDMAILPQAQQRLEAATAAYAAGRGELVGVIAARRELLELRLRRVALEAEAARQQVRLEYFAVSGEAS